MKALYETPAVELVKFAAMETIAEGGALGGDPESDPSADMGGWS